MSERRDILVLTLAAGAGALLCALAWALLGERIGNAARAESNAAFVALLPGIAFDNEPAAEQRSVLDPPRLGYDEPRTAWLARREGRIEAVILPVRAPDGYAGAIELLVAVDRAGTLRGVQLRAHRETPGLGDRIEPRHGDWLQKFEGRSLGDVPAERWAPERDGGSFDGLSGASVTARAVTRALRLALEHVAADPGLFSANEEAHGDG